MAPPMSWESVLMNNEYGREGHMTFCDCRKWALSLTRQVDHEVKGVGRKALQAPRGDDEFVLEGSEYDP